MASTLKTLSPHMLNSDTSLTATPTSSYREPDYQSTFPGTPSTIGNRELIPTSTSRISISDALAWATCTQNKLQRARILEHEIESQVEKNATAVARCQQGITNTSEIVQKKLQDVMLVGDNLAKDINKQIVAVENVAKEVRNSIVKLQRSHRSKWAPLCVVKRRLDIRETRPLLEFTHDPWQAAMVAERDLLVSARQKICERINGSKDFFLPLQEVKQEMLEDLRKKRHTNRIEHVTYLEGRRRGSLSVAELMVQPTLVEVLGNSYQSPQDAPRGTERDSEECRKLMTKNLIARASKLMSMALAHCKQNMEIALLCDQQCAAANATAEAKMWQHIKTLKDSKKMLEERLKEVQKKLFVGQLSGESTDKNLRQHEGPLQQINRQFNLRQHRLDGEHIRDQVHDRLEQHLDEMKKSVEVLSQHVDSTTNLVDQLRNSQQQLVESLKLKSQVIRIDTSCTKVTLKSVSSLFYAEPRDEDVSDDHYNNCGNVSADEIRPLGYPRNCKMLSTGEVAAEDDAELANIDAMAGGNA